VDHRETQRILQVLRDVGAAGGRAAIATVVRVKGSAYRREGARIVIREDGTHECLLSGGCLEPAVAAAAADVIRTGDATIVSYDLEEDSVLGLGIGCSGEVDIRIERVEDDVVTREWLAALRREEAAVLVTPLSGATGRLLVRDDGTTLGGLSDRAAEARAIAAARERSRESPGRSGAERLDQVEVFYEISEPPPSLTIFGAGLDAVPLARLGVELGFRVTVVDVREAYLTGERFPGVTLVSAHSSEFAQRVPVSSSGYVVVMNHHLERDQESLRYALEAGAQYVGVLGPRTRYQKLLKALREEGRLPIGSALERVRSPVGLALGAETPDEIAVSIVGEILATRRGFEGGFLDGRIDSLHRPSDARVTARS
jgi:xanthine dehydrogenase accessory factor